GGRIWTPPPSWEVLGSLSLRGTSGERAGERGTFHRIGAANWNPLSLPLSPLLRRGARESTSGMVVVPSCALGRKAALLILFDLLNHWFFGNQGLPMRHCAAILMVAALACGVGCRKKEAGERAGQQAETDVLVRCHFVGTASLSNNTNATKLKELWSLPETQRLAEQTLRKLAHAPRTLYGEQVTTSQDDRGAPCCARCLVICFQRYSSCKLVERAA